MQVASRILVVWGVVDPFPEIVYQTRVFGTRTSYSASEGGGQYAYAGILVAWGVTECIRYGFFVWKEGRISGAGGGVPGWLQWLRYNTFYVLYPLGISSECWLIYQAIGPAKEEGGPGGVERYDMFLKAVLLIYVPGSYILYTHMMGQRRRIMKGKGKST